MKLAFLGIVIAVTAAQVYSQDEAGFHSRRLVTSPDGKFQIDWVSAGLAIKPVEDGARRVALLTPPRMDKADGEIPDAPFVFVSPDDHWVFVAWRSGGYEPDAVAELYQLNGESGLMPGFATKERFDRLAWKFMAQQEGIDSTTIAMPSTKGKAREIAFAAWSSDSARLLISLSASLGEPTGDSVLLAEGIGSWLCYFNTRTGEFELTDRLRTFNRDARKRWRNQFWQVGRETFPLAAEPFGQEGPWLPPKERLDRADHRLNEHYTALMEKLAPAAQKRLRQEKREWLIQRDTEASIHAHQSWSPAPEAALLEGEAIATEARATELEKRIQKLVPAVR